MPAQQKQKLVSAEKRRENVIFYLGCLRNEVRKHEDQTEKDISFPTFVHMSGGMMRHHSEYEKDALFDAYNSFDKEYSKLVDIFWSKRWKSSYAAQVRSMEKLIELSQLIRDIFDADYIFRQALWRGGSMGLSEEVESAAEKANTMMQRLHKTMASHEKTIQREFSAMTKCLEAEKASADNPKTVSPKSKRSNNVKKSLAAISVQ